MVYRCVAIMASLFALIISSICLNPASYYTSDECRHLIPTFPDFQHYWNQASGVELFSVLLHRSEHASHSRLYASHSNRMCHGSSYVLIRIIMTRHEFLRRIKNSFLIPIWASETNRYFREASPLHTIIILLQMVHSNKHLKGSLKDLMKLKAQVGYIYLHFYIFSYRSN